MLGTAELESISKISLNSWIKMVGFTRVGRYLWVMMQMVRHNLMIGFWLLMVATRQKYVTTQWTICHATLQLMIRKVMDGNVRLMGFQLVNHWNRVPIKERVSMICVQMSALVHYLTFLVVKVDLDNWIQIQLLELDHVITFLMCIF